MPASRRSETGCCVRLKSIECIHIRITSARIGIANIFNSNVSVDAWGRNIAGELYYITMSNTPLSISQGPPGLPQMFGATIRATF